MNTETIVISLGGSLIIPEEIDTAFLRDFKTLILAEVGKGKKFLMITGGGKVCRKYQNAAKEISDPSNEELDMLGIKALNLNAELVKILFKDMDAVSIYGAEKPGSSTDLGAILLAKNNNAKTVINLSNIDYAYDSDPKINTDAKPITSTTWAEYRKLIPAEWNPGLNSPFDPIASKEAQDLNIKVIIMNGKNLNNLEAFFEGKDFIGTTIS